jgi:general secretion pathway protein K
MSLSLTVRGETERAGVTTDGLRCRYLATGAVERASVELIWAAMYPSMRQVPLDGSPISYTFPSGTASVEIIPETSKLNVNFISAAELYRLAAALGVDPARAGEIAQGIVSWRDPGAVAYPSLNPSFPPSHASFQEIEDLLLVKGVTPDIFYGTYLPAEAQGGPRLVRRYGLVDCLSVYGARDRVDVNSANPAVLAAVGLNPQAVASIAAQRKQGPIGLTQLPSVIESAAAPADRLRVGGGSIYTLRATARLQAAGGRASDVSRTVAALVKYMPVQPPIHILRWYDSVWSN